MTQVRGGCCRGRMVRATTAIALVTIAAMTGACRGRSASSAPGSAELRIGWGQASSTTNPAIGLRQLSQRLTTEGLARPADDGRMVASLAESWQVEPGGRSIVAKVRRNIKFHDGSPATAGALADTLLGAMKAFVGPTLSAEIDGIEAITPDTIRITFRQPSQFAIESLEAGIQKPNGVGTGAFKALPNSTSDLVANDDYYLGAPAIKRVRVETFPSIRSAWADMLRDRIDMLYEVGPEALPSLENASTITVFTYTRPYQFVLIFNSRAPALASATVRRALNAAVNRDELVRNALNGYGVASDGPVWPKHWALPANRARPAFDPSAATMALGSHFHFTCLVPPDTVTERVALEVKRQLAAIGVVMEPEQVSFDDLGKRAAAAQYQALLVEVISGQSILRPYIVWHSQGSFNYGKFGTSTSDTALDRVRRAQSDSDYRSAVAGLQQDFIDDPPAIFLAWSVRARAISRRFIVPDAEAGRDVLSTIRLWKPSNGDLRASRN
jgi:peptide/nickel transport system substrate-binding protein